MTVLAVDLAAKYSAACLMDDDYNVLKQFDSWQVTEEQFIYLCAADWLWCWGDEEPPEVMVVEDLPHGLRYSTLVKTVLRLQGRFVQAMHEMPHGQTEDILFAAPAEWRRTFPGLERGTGPEAVVPVAAGLGYTPPDLTARTVGKGAKAIARKVQTDYCSAYLIARWAIDTKKTHGTFDVIGTSRYSTKVIRKKDFNDQDN